MIRKSIGAAILAATILLPTVATAQVARGVVPSSNYQPRLATQARVNPIMVQPVAPTYVAQNTSRNCGAAGCSVTTLPHVNHKVHVSCRTAFSGAAMRRTTDGGQLFVAKAAGPGFCVKTPRGVFAYVKGGEKVSDNVTGQTCLRFTSPEGYTRLFWKEGNTWKSRQV